jgi:Mg-chelatase subunit ChlD
VLDVALVLDLSTSMRADTRGGRPKVEAALEAAAAFVALLDLSMDGSGTGDRAAIVGFNDRAWTEQGLTGDRGELQAALGRLAPQTAANTRLDLAVAAGAEAALGNGHRADALAVMVLLTDGRPTAVPPGEDGRPESTVLAQAEAARLAGVRLFTIGVGTAEDVDASLLRAMATEWSGYLYAPDAEDLRAIYAELAATVRCPSGLTRWGRPVP